MFVLETIKRTIDNVDRRSNAKEVIKITKKMQAKAASQERSS
jgi:hypothetical protein